MGLTNQEIDELLANLDQKNKDVKLEDNSEEILGYDGAYTNGGQEDTEDNLDEMREAILGYSAAYTSDIKKEEQENQEENIEEIKSIIKEESNTEEKIKSEEEIIGPENTLFYAKDIFNVLKNMRFPEQEIDMIINLNAIEVERNGKKVLVIEYDDLINIMKRKGISYDSIDTVDKLRNLIDDLSTKNEPKFDASDIAYLLESMKISKGEVKYLVDSSISKNNKIYYSDLIGVLAKNDYNDIISIIDTPKKLQNVILALHENSAVNENHFKSLLLDLGVSKKVLSKIFKKLNVTAVYNDKGDFIANVVDYYEVMGALEENGTEIFDEISTLEKVYDNLYPEVNINEVLDFNELDEQLKKFHINKINYFNIYEALNPIRNYESNKSYYLKEDIQKVLIDLGYDYPVIDSILNQSNEVMETIIDVCFTKNIKICDFQAFADYLRRGIKIGPKDTLKVVDGLEQMADLIEDLKETFGVDNLDTSISLNELIKLYKSVDVSFEDEDADLCYQKIGELIKVYNKMRSSINYKSILEYANEHNIKISLKNIKTKKAKKKVKRDKDKRVKKGRKKKVKVSKKSKSLKESSLLYEFFITGKKYYGINEKEMSAKDIKSWLEKNNKIFKKLSKFSKNKDNIKVSQVIEELAPYLKYALSYNENNAITNANYLKNLKSKNLDEEQLNEVEDSLYNARQVVYEYIFNTNLYESDELKKWEKANKFYKRGKLLAALTGLVATIAVGSFAASYLSKNKENDNTTIEVTMEDNDNYDFDASIDENKEEENSVLDASSITSETNNNEVEDNNTQTESNAETKDEVEVAANEENSEIITEVTSEETEEVEENSNTLTESNTEIEEVATDKEVEESNIVENNEKEVEDKVEIASEEATSNEISNSYISFSETVDITNTAKVYTNVYNLANDENAKKSYFGSNPEIGRSIEAVEVIKDNVITLAFTDDEVNNFLNDGYKIIGYRLSNMYGQHEGFYKSDDVMVLSLKR